MPKHVAQNATKKAPISSGVKTSAALNAAHTVMTDHGYKPKTSKLLDFIDCWLGAQAASYVENVEQPLSDDLFVRFIEVRADADISDGEHEEEDDDETISFLSKATNVK